MRTQQMNRRNWRYRSRLLEEEAASAPPLSEELPAYFFLQPSLTNGAGYNAVTGVEDFTPTWTPISGDFSTGPRGQEMVNFAGTDIMNANSGAFDGTPLVELHEDSAFWVLITVSPGGSVTSNLRGLQTTNAASAGWRVSYSNSVGGISSGVYLHDGTSNVSLALPVGKFADWDSNDTNTILVIFDIAGGLMTAMANNRGQRTTSFQQKDISGLSFPAATSPRANTILPQIDTIGDIMVACGSGVPTDEQAERLMKFGAGTSYSEFTGETAHKIHSWRAEAVNGGATPSIRVVGCASEAPILRLYPATNRTTHGSLLKSSVDPVDLDDQGWFSYLFAGGLSNDTDYWIEARYANGEVDCRRIITKTLPASIDGLKFAVGGCWELDPLIDNNNAISTEFMERTVMQAMIDQDPDFFTGTGDDFYYDYLWTDLGNTPPIDDADDFQTVHKYVADQLKANNFFTRVPHVMGIFSDHDYLENDVFGADATAAQIAAAQAHWTSRTGQTYPLAPDNMYHSRRMVFNDTSITFIKLDMRTEAEAGVQLTSVAQRAQMQTDATTAVTNGDLIVLYSEYALDEGETPSPPGSWTRFATERQDIVDRLATAGVTNKIILLYGDQHAGGCDIAAVNQVAAWDTGSGVRPVCVLASRANSPNAASSAGATTHPDYFDSGNGHIMYITVDVNTTQLDVTVTPVEGNTVKTSIGPRTIG